jgi:hypothetical protein
MFNIINFTCRVLFETGLRYFGDDYIHRFITGATVTDLQKIGGYGV